MRVPRELSLLRLKTHKVEAPNPAKMIKNCAFNLVPALLRAERRGGKEWTNVQNIPSLMEKLTILLSSLKFIP